MVLSGACVALGLAVLGFALTRPAGQRVDSPTGAVPVIVVSAPTPAPSAIAAATPPRRTVSPLGQMRAAWRRALVANEATHVPAAWVAGFYPLYERAQRVFKVNWLLIASVHRQETAFSTAGGTYHGRNFAGCCAGPMQFNVTNGPTTTWERFRNAFHSAGRPASYPHPTAAHPSVYDDFDAMMAAAHLLAYEGATTALDGAAWRAAYDYYGHDLTGVGYADEVLARAIGWSQHGFSINQPGDPRRGAAGEAAGGAPVRAALVAGTRRQKS
jgi:hypothetical protein